MGAIKQSDFLPDMAFAVKEFEKLIRRELVRVSGKKAKDIDFNIDILSLISDPQVSFYPKTPSQLAMLRIGSCSDFYKLRFRDYCTQRHQLAIEVLEYLGFSHDSIDVFIGAVAAIDPVMLDLFDTFSNELDSNNPSPEAVLELIDELPLHYKTKKVVTGTIISHSSKMTDPSCKFPRIFYSDNEPSKNGFLHSGQMNTELDMHIDATKLKVYKFLCLNINGETVLDAVQKNCFRGVQQFFGIDDTRTEKWLSQFRECITPDDNRTHSNIRQVYFPTSTDKPYHLLSILKPSGAVFSLKKRIDSLNRSGQFTYIGRSARRRSVTAAPYKSIVGLTETKHGGDHPKNISGLNNKYQSYYLLNSTPPTFAKTATLAPKKDVFKGPLSPKRCTATFEKMHRVFLAMPRPDLPREKLRKALQNCLADLLNFVIEKALEWRAVAGEQTHRIEALPYYQQLWLNDARSKERLEGTDWLNQLSAAFAQWVVSAYTGTIEDAVLLGAEEQAWIQEWAVQQQEVFKL